MGKSEFLKAMALVAILSSAVAITNSNKPIADRIAIKSVQIESVGDKLLTEHMEHIRIEKEEARVAELKRQEELKKVAEAEEAKKVEEAKKKAEAKRIAEAKKTQEAKITASRGNAGTKMIFKLSFYTALPYRNGGKGLMANGKEVATAYNAVASNYYKMGTKIYLKGYGTFTVQDRGGSGFNSSQRLDVLIHQKSGESDSVYEKRVMNMGRVEVEGYIEY